MNASEPNNEPCDFEMDFLIFLLISIVTTIIFPPYLCCGEMTIIKSMLKITHVIFDLDGLLIDTEVVFSKVNQCLLSKYDKKFTPHLRGLVTGMPKKAAVTYILEHEKLSGKVDVDEYCKKYDEMAEEMLPKCSLMPGVMKLVRHLKTHRIPMAICTGATKKEFEIKTRHHKELLDLISLWVLSGDDPAIKRGKPAPDPFLVTMDRFKQKPEKAENVLVFEDATNGVCAAIAAGMNVVMVPDLTYMKIPEGLENKINSVLKSLEDFKPESVGLPAYDASSNE